MRFLNELQYEKTMTEGELVLTRYGEVGVVFGNEIISPNEKVLKTMTDYNENLEDGYYRFSAPENKPAEILGNTGYMIVTNRYVNKSDIATKPPLSSTGYMQTQIIFTSSDNIYFRMRRVIDGSGSIKETIHTLSKLSTYSELDTPYYATKMQQEEIYEDFVTYMDSKLEYEKQQREIETQHQLAFEHRENQEQSYEDWLSTQPQLMPVVEPQPSQALLDFKKKYLG